MNDKRIGAPTKQTAEASDHDLRVLNRVLNRARENKLRDRDKNSVVVRNLLEVVKIFEEEHHARVLETVEKPKKVRRA